MDDYTQDNFRAFCDLLAAKDHRLKQIITDHGYPPFWHREPDFASLVRIILEQQVSLASALACFQKLKGLVRQITPDKVLALADDDLKSCGFSRQKVRYVKNLASEIAEGRLSLGLLSQKSSAEIREELIAIKGIGHWTIDVFLLNCLHKLDILPIGDLVLIKSLIKASFIKPSDTKETVLQKTETYRPYRSILTILLWHNYLRENGIDNALLE